MTPPTLDELMKLAEAATQPDGYRVLPDGRVFSIKSNWRGYGDRLLTQFPNSNGYPRVKLTIKGKAKNYVVHRLVAAIYIGAKPSPNHQICHRDGNREHNHVSNLYWGTAKENAADRSRHGNCKAAANGRASAKPRVNAKGYSFCKTRKKWGAYIEVNKNKKFLGYFAKEADAAKARRDAIDGLAALEMGKV